MAAAGMVAMGASKFVHRRKGDERQKRFARTNTDTFIPANRSGGRNAAALREFIPHSVGFVLIRAADFSAAATFAQAGPCQDGI